MKQARHLATRERRKPLQASLRRAVSTAYYAVFHCLIEAASAEVAGASPRFRNKRDLVARAFDHGAMKEACLEISRSCPKPILRAAAVSYGLAGDVDGISVAESFVDLQEARHQADYDVSAVLTKAHALQMVATAEDAVATWRRLKSASPQAAALFSVILLLWGALRRR